MKIIRNLFFLYKNISKTAKKFSPLRTSLLFLSLPLISTPTLADCPHITISKDGTPISYEVYGRGEPTLVFIHGWNCDTRYWRAQVPYFSEKHQVVVPDLAGHGHLGMTRTDCTMKSFGEDVQLSPPAVATDALNETASQT